jgi:hypothetical protein
MLFGFPSAFWLAALMVPIIGLYILKIRLRRVSVSTNLFWRQIYDEKPPRSIWQYLRHLLSLLVQLLLLWLLIAAVADPLLSWQQQSSRRIVVIIDNSASMNATDVAPTRLEAAKQDALRSINNLRFFDKMAIVLAGPSPEVIIGMNDHAPTLRQKVRDIKPSDNPTLIDPALRLAERLVGDEPNGEILVLSDGCFELPAIDTSQTEAQALPLKSDASTRTSWRIFATPVGNVGITQFQVRRALNDPLGYEIMMSVVNAGAEPVQVRLEIELNENVVDILPLRLKPEEHWKRTIQKTSMVGGRLKAKLTELVPDVAAGNETRESEDESTEMLNGLSSDDVAWAILPDRKLQPVLIVTPGNLFLHKVFEANPLVRLEVRSEFPTEWPANTLIVLHRNVPEQLPPGNVFVVDPIAGCDEWKVGGELENPIVTDQDKQSTLMMHVRLDNVIIPKARMLEFPRPPHVLAGTVAGSPVYAEVTRTTGKCLVLTASLDEGDLAFRTAFPIMVVNALAWFSGESGELRAAFKTGAIASFQPTSETITAGESITIVSPLGQIWQSQVVERSMDQTVTAKTGRWQRPATGVAPSQNQVGAANGEAAPPEAGADFFPVSVGPLSEVGLWQILRPADETDGSEQSEPLQQLAVNLSDERESDLRPHDDLIEQNVATLREGAWLANPLWYFLIWAAMLLGSVEWFLYQRRIVT